MNEPSVTVITCLITFFFVFAGSIKILGWQKLIFETQLQFFIKYGLNRRVMALVGIVELFGAIAIWLPGFIGITGALAIFATSAGAIFCHLRFDTWKDGIPAMITLILSGLILWAKLSTSGVL